MLNIGDESRKIPKLKFIGEQLTFQQEPSNQHDNFGVAVMRNSVQIAGHVPIGISRIIMFFAIQHGCTIQAVVEDTKCYQSPITQGGLEIKTMVTCTWSELRRRTSNPARKQGMISERYLFVTRLTDDFDSILREIESRLVLHDSVDELTINQIDDYYRRT